MPLVVVCGRPCVGKSAVAALLADYLVACGTPREHVVVLDHVGAGEATRRAGFSSACAAGQGVGAGAA